MQRPAAKVAWEKFYERQPRPWGGAVLLPGLPPGVLVLELGCGGGRLLLPLLKFDKDSSKREIIGIDHARSCLKDLYKDCGGILVQGSVTTLPFPDGKFDVVLCRHVMEHLVEPEREHAAGEILRIVKPGGIVRFASFSIEDARVGKGVKVEEGTYLRGDDILYHYFTEEEARSLFKGGKVVLCRTLRWSEKVGRGRTARAVVEAEIMK